MIPEWVSSGDVAAFSPMILSCRGQGRPRQYIQQFGFPSFVLGHFFLLGVGLGLEMEWAEASRTF